MIIFLECKCIVKNAYKLIQKHHNLTDIYNILSHKAPQDYLEQFQKAKDLFTKMIESDEINNVILTKKTCDMEKISPYLQKYTNLTEKQINNRLKVINNFTQ